MRMIAAVRPIRPEFSFLTGWEAVLAPMLMVGCDGGTHASSNAVPEVTRRIFELSRAGSYAEAMQWQHRILELFDVMLYSFEFPDGFRAAAELRGFQFGRSRQPQTSSQNSDRTRLSAVLHCLLADFELVEPPPGGCKPRERSGERVQVERVVLEVIQALQKRGMV